MVPYVQHFNGTMVGKAALENGEFLGIVGYVQHITEQPVHRAQVLLGDVIAAAVLATRCLHVAACQHTHTHTHTPRDNNREMAHAQDLTRQRRRRRFLPSTHSMARSTRSSNCTSTSTKSLAGAFDGRGGMGGACIGPNDRWPARLGRRRTADGVLPNTGPTLDLRDTGAAASASPTTMLLRRARG